VQPGPTRTTRCRAAGEAVNEPRTNTAAPLPVQPTDTPAPVQPSPNARYRATVEDADDDDDYPFVPNATAPLPRNPPIHVIFDATPRRRRHQEDPVDEGGTIEDKSHRCILHIWLVDLNCLRFQVTRLFQTLRLLPNCSPPPWTPRLLTIIVSPHLFLQENNSLHHCQPLLKGHPAPVLVRVQDSPVVPQGRVLIVQTAVVQFVLLLAISNASRHKMFGHFLQRRRGFTSAYSARQYRVSLILFFLTCS